MTEIKPQAGSVIHIIIMGTLSMIVVLFFAWLCGLFEVILTPFERFVTTMLVLLYVAQWRPK